MSENLQIGQHPDADQLNAFVEQSLPAHERELTLAHLAECAHCRQIVALSLPPIEEAVVEEQETPERRWLGGWLSGWRLAWIAAPALAALVVLTVYLQTKATAPRQAGQRAQVAEVHPLAPKPQASVTSKDNPPPVKPSSRQTLRSAAAAKSAKASPPRAETDVDALPVNGRNFALAKQAPVTIEPGAAATSTNGAVAGSASGLAPIAAPTASGFASQVVSAAPMRQAAPANSPLSPPKPIVASASPPAPGFAAPAVSNSFSPASAAGRSGSMGQMHSFAGASALRKSSVAALTTPLPSGQPVLSIAANASQRLALDMQNHLFFSEDEGRHWKQVAPTWQGRIVAVATALATPSSPKLLSFASPERFTPDAHASDEISAQPDVPNSSLSGLVTDATGAVIPGATITVKEGRYAITRTEKTDAVGRYLFANLAPGTYRIDAQALGFASLSLAENLKPEQAVRNITLSAGAATQTVTVDAASVQLETQSRSVDAPADKVRQVAAQPAAAPRPPIFVVTTDRGVSWTSSDGLTWHHE